MAKANCITIFEKWLKSNEHRFKGHEPILIKRRKRGRADYRFNGITKHIELWVRADGGCVVTASRGEDNVDLIYDLDVYPEKTKYGKYFCSMCTKYRGYYESIERLFISQACEYLVQWVKDNLTDSKKLLMVVWGGGSSYANILDTKQLVGKKHKRWKECTVFEVVNVVTGSLDPHYDAISIHEAASCNELSEVRILLKAGVDPNIENDEGLTALHFALAHGNMACARLLIRSGAKLNPKGRGALRALSVAASHGYVPPVKFLLSRGVNPNGEPKLKSKWTPLHMAVTDPGNSYVTITKLLLKHHANPRAKDSAGRTPIALLEEWKKHPDNTPQDLKTYNKRKLLLEKALHR